MSTGKQERNEEGRLQDIGCEEGQKEETEREGRPKITGKKNR